MFNAQIIEQLKKLNLNMFMQELEEQEKNKGYKVIFLIDYHFCYKEKSLKEKIKILSEK
ncbi:hypothetical protein ACWNT8_13300 [Pigmentibacter ruber]|nr:hypothetical protein GTC16762_13370 [Pigmentibacter ruber]